MLGYHRGAQPEEFLQVILVSEPDIDVHAVLHGLGLGRGDVCNGPVWPAAYAACRAAPRSSLVAPIAWPPAERGCIILTSPRTQARARLLLGMLFVLKVGDLHVLEGRNR
jgi:hypothetical protein